MQCIIAIIGQLYARRSHHWICLRQRHVRIDVLWSATNCLKQIRSDREINQRVRNNEFNSVAVYVFCAIPEVWVDTP
jgi:hypothetical protein